MLIVAAACWLPLAHAQASHPEVLVVYNTNFADSLTVAQHYMTVRNIPGGNLCAITPPANDFIQPADYTNTVLTPVQNCLNAVGKTSILYIVMSYLTPFAINAEGPMGGAALDSYLADAWNKYLTQTIVTVPNATQPYYADSQSQGNYYQPFQSFATYRANARNPLIYSVWRLDGPSEAIASALVDQAISAENSGGPSGQACIDRRFGDLTSQTDAGEVTGDFDLFQAGAFLGQAGITVTEDSNTLEFGPNGPSGDPPDEGPCPDTALYSGWYSYDNYNNAFTWQTGSIGWHLDSASALNPRSGPSWVPNALSAGIAVTSGSVTEPYLQGLVRPGGTFRNLLEGASVGDAFLRNTRWLKWEIMYVGDPLYKPFASHTGPSNPFNPLQAVNSFQIAPQEIVGGTNTAGTLTLSSAAPSGGTVFTMNAGVGTGITVPSTVTVAANATKASFTINTAAVTQSQAVAITATSPSTTLKNTIITDPLLGGFLASVGTTMAGFPVTMQAVLNGPAPLGGAKVFLSSDNPAITVPASATVGAGLEGVVFTAASTPVTSSVTPNITGRYAGAAVSIGIAVVPAIGGFDASPNTITAGQTTNIELATGATAPSTMTFNLISDDPASLPVPATLTVVAGTHYVNTIGQSSAGASGKTVHLTVSGYGATSTVTVTIN